MERKLRNWDIAAAFSSEHMRQRKQGNERERGTRRQSNSGRIRVGICGPLDDIIPRPPREQRENLGLLLHFIEPPEFPPHYHYSLPEIK